MPNPPEKVLKSIEIDAQIVELKRSGLSFDEIGKRLGGLTRQTIHRRFERALLDARKARREAADKYIDEHLARIGVNREIVSDIRDGEHPLVSNGKRFDDLVDQGIVLASIDRMVKLDDEEAQLLGLRAATKSEVAVVNYTVGGGIDPTKDLT